MKGLVLSGGKGSRLRPLTYTGAKQLVPIANKPVLFYALEDLVEAGITEIGIIVGETKEQIRGAVGDGSQFGAKVTYIEQKEPLGIAHAILMGEGFIGRDPFVVFLGDNFLRGGISSFVRSFQDSEANGQLILSQVPRPEEFGVAVLREGRVTQLIEKPQKPVSNLAIVGIYMLDHHFFQAAKEIRPSARGELEITDALQVMIDKELDVRAVLLQDWWIDTGKKDDLLEANRLILETLETKIEGEVSADSRLDGRVQVAPGARVLDSVIRGPAIIGAHAVIQSSYIGPFTSIDHHCRVERAEIEHSIIMDNTQVIDVGHRIEESLIGRYVEVVRSTLKPRAYKLVLGDHSRVGVL